MIIIELISLLCKEAGQLGVSGEGWLPWPQWHKAVQIFGRSFPVANSSSLTSSACSLSVGTLERGGSTSAGGAWSLCVFTQ